MKKLASMLLLASILSACGLLGGLAPSLSTQSISLQRGSSVVVGVIADGVFDATVTSAPTGGLEVTYAKLRPNPKNVRGHLYVTVLSSAPLGKQTVMLKSESNTLTLEVNVTASASVSLTRGLGRANTVAGAAGVITWIKKDGTVWQRVAGVSSQVLGITNARTVGATNAYLIGFVGYAATVDGQVWTWQAGKTPTLFNQIEGGVLDMVIDKLAMLVLATDGRVWNLKAGGATLEPDASDVVSVGVSGYESFVGGGTKLTLVTRTFVKTDGKVQLTTTYDYVPAIVPEPITRKITVSDGSRTSDGHVYVYFGTSLLHHYPAKQVESNFSLKQLNATTSSFTTNIYALFDDGGLWLSKIVNTFGENQQGAPTNSGDITQTAVVIPNGEDVIDFSNQGLLAVWTSSGVYIANDTLVSSTNPLGLELVDLTDVRLPTL